MCNLPVLILSQEPVIVISFPHPAEERRDREALAGIWCPAGVNPAQSAEESLMIMYYCQWAEVWENLIIENWNKIEGIKRTDMLKAESILGHKDLYYMSNIAKWKQG